MNKATNISAKHKPTLSFPHYINRRGNECDVIQKPDEQLKVGDKICFYDADTLGGSSIISVDNVRTAKGDWSAYPFTPIFSTITF